MPSVASAKIIGNISSNGLELSGRGSYPHHSSPHTYHTTWSEILAASPVRYSELLCAIRFLVSSTR